MSASIFKPARFARLFLADARNVSRDPTLLFAIVMSVVPAIAVFAFRGAANEAALAAFGVENFMQFMVPVAICLPAFLIGWVTGFLFLEDRDDGPLLALDVTPVGKGGFLAYRATVTAAIAALLTLLGWALMIPETGFGMLVILSVMVAMEAVSAAFVLPAIARNKVEGLALTKLTNIAAVVPLVAIVPFVWRYAAGIVPTFWVGELLGISQTALLPWGASAILGLLAHLVVMVALYRLLLRKSG